MLNSTETPTGDSLVDIEGLEDASPMKKLDFGLAETATTEQGKLHPTFRNEYDTRKHL